MMNRNLLIQLSVILLIGLWSCKGANSQENVIGVTQKSPSGLEYVLHKQGNGRKAEINDFVKFSFFIYSENGSLIVDNAPPELYPVIRIKDPNLTEEVNPFMEAMIGRQAGDSLTIKVPVSSLGNNYVALGMDEFVRCEMQISRIMDELENIAYSDSLTQAREEAAEIARQRAEGVGRYLRTVLEKYKSGELKTQTTNTGLELAVHEIGKGSRIIQGMPVNVHYYGILHDGTMFDNSFSGGEPLTVAAGTGRVIKGWDDALSILPKGSKATLFLDSELAYGKNGYGSLVPPDTDLVFYIEIEDTPK